jgi:predicted RNA-binding protein YlxR (DUF448 family)
MVRVRTCLGCRLRVDASELIRVVVRDGIATSDPSASLDGRGSWVHPTRECVDASIKRKAWSRALRANVDTSRLTSDLQPQITTEQAD